MLPLQPAIAQNQEAQPQPQVENNEQLTEAPELEPGREEIPEPAQSNPLEPAGTDIDTIIKARINDDLWEAMKGELPCLVATRECISELQAAATGRNPLLLEIDERIEEINAKIEEAKVSNKKSIRLSVLTPGLQALLSPQTITQNGRTRTTGGFLSNILAIFTNPVGIVDKLLSAVGVPLLQSAFGGNEQNQRNAIAISDLQVKSAELQRGRAELAQKIREQVYLAVFDYDDAAREFQIAQEVAKRDAARMQLLEVEYRFGEGNTNSYLNSLNSLDGKKGQTYRAWATLRSRLEKIKLLVLGLDQ